MVWGGRKMGKASCYCTSPNRMRVRNSMVLVLGHMHTCTGMMVAGGDRVGPKTSKTADCWWK